MKPHRLRPILVALALLSALAFWARQRVGAGAHPAPIAARERGTVVGIAERDKSVILDAIGREDRDVADATQTSTAPPSPATFAAGSRPGGLFKWRVDIVGRSLFAALTSHASLDVGGEANVGVDADGLHVATGLYSFNLPWDDVKQVYVATTTDQEFASILCVQPRNGPPIVLIDVDLGAQTTEVAEAASRYVAAHNALAAPQ